MNAHADEIRRCLEAVDVRAMRRAWHRVFPHLPQPTDDGKMLIVIHYARTEMRKMSLRLRAYSHRWLLERDLPSGLPDELKPQAERMYPRFAEGVGISVNTKRRSPLLKIAAEGVHAAMTDAVLEAYADNRTDPVFVKQRMAEARERQEKYFAEILKGR